MKLDHFKKFAPNIPFYIYENALLVFYFTQ